MIRGSCTEYASKDASRSTGYSMEELEALAGALTAFGQVTTNLVFSSQVLDPPLLPAR